jgi:hypothetical protein
MVAHSGQYGSQKSSTEGPGCGTGSGLSKRRPVLAAAAAAAARFLMGRAAAGRVAACGDPQ